MCWDDVFFAIYGGCFTFLDEMQLELRLNIRRHLRFERGLPAVPQVPLSHGLEDIMHSCSKYAIFTVSGRPFRPNTAGIANKLRGCAWHV